MGRTNPTRGITAAATLRAVQVNWTTPLGKPVTIQKLV